MVDDDAELQDSLLARVARIPAKRLEVWEPPAALDEYRLIKTLGQGGMGSVWLAEDQLLARLVAIKFIHGHLDEHARERFAIEARAAARLQHTNVVTVHRFGEIAGRPYLVSEYIRGESLDKVGKPMAWQRVLELGVALARGLAAAHRGGVVHRDIKPANAILTPDGDVKLVDFGLAKLADEVERHPQANPDDIETLSMGQASTLRAPELLTAPGAVAGTPLYLAPEVRAGEPASRRSDVYQVGCILYELLTGRAPLLDLPGGPAAAQRSEVPSLSPHVGADGVKLAVVVDRCLRRVVDERYASGDELREAIEKLAVVQIGGELPEGNPYRGLVAFEAEHRALFFGRGAEIRDVIERLRSDAFVLVTGDSGVGKSSLCRAGVLPNVTDGAFADNLAWDVVQLVPGPHPLQSFAAAIASLVEIDEHAMRDQPVIVARALRRALGRERGLLIFCDQFEELVTIADREDAVVLAHVLAHLAGAPNMRVLATVRGDFVTRVTELPGVDLARALYVLRPLSPEGAREAIVGPARAKGARFESDALVAALVGEGEHVELPLLAFTLARLWDARDPATQVISARSLAAIGGVRGALAQHADGVIERLLPAQRAAVRRILLRLVTAERTRARLGTPALGADDDPETRAALDALVRGRLVVARGADPPMFEIAHERLIDGWPTLSEWLSRTAEARAIHARLATAAADWDRMDRARDALWRDRQLVDLVQLAGEDLTSRESAFAEASRGAARRRRNMRIAVAVAIPAIAVAVYAAARTIMHHDVAREIDTKLVAADRDLVSARSSADQLAGVRAAVVAEFDVGHDIDKRWRLGRVKEATAADAYGRASAALEAALLLDPERRDIRHRIAEVTFERIGLADLMYRLDERDELMTRLSVYDAGEHFMRRLRAPAKVELVIEPQDATVTIDGNATAARLEPGTHVVVARAPGRAVVRDVLFLHGGDTKRVAFTLPPATAVPTDFVYIPPGEFLFGSNDDEPIRRFLNTAPMHPRTIAGYLIGRTEVTYAQWIAFLDDIDPASRARHAPQVERTTTIHKSGGVVLVKTDAGWKLQMAPSGVIVYEALAGAPIEYQKRTRRARQDWLRMPISGITPEDVEAYTAWLDRTKRVPGARLCTEAEWERAARGADGRMFPNGNSMLAPDDANFDETYGREDAAFGPDEAGAHPATTSPFGIDDMSGNVWEITRSSTNALVLRGGAFYVNAHTAVLSNRGETITRSFRHVLVGVRICADLATTRP